jgi:hypothetical protein
MPNFINHFKSTCEVFADDDRTSYVHVALYMSLFYHWNDEKFMDNMPMNRREVMRTARIGSYKLYYRVLRDLHNWGYITYSPSHYPRVPSRVTIQDPENPVSRSPVGTTVDSTKTPERPPSINNTNSINETRGNNPAPVSEKERSVSTRHSRPVDLKEAVDYFREQKQSVLEAEKFYNYYQGNGWARRDRTPIQDWQAVARSWILKIGAFEKEKISTARGPQANHLTTNNDKDFAEPL